MNKKSKKIGIVIFWYPLGVSPSLINLAKVLADERFCVEILIDRISFSQAPVDFESPRIKLHLIDNVPAPGSAHALDVLKGFWKFSEKINHYIQEDFKAVIGVDTFGIIASQKTVYSKKIPLIYFNLELMLSKECKTIKDKIIKYFEKKASQKASLVMIQDDKRAELLAFDNHLDKSKFFNLPVSNLGKAGQRSEFLRKRLGIPKSKKILLYAGEIAPWAMCLELVRSAQGWPDNNILVMHSSRLTDESRKHLSYLQKADKKRRVFFSTKPVPWQDTQSLISSADVGLAFYKDFGKNFTEIGLSSGKIASYLQAGLPVITSDFPSLRRVISDNQCGLCSDDLSKIPLLAKKIFLHYNFYRNSALRCFEKNYDMANYSKKLIEQITKL